MSKAVSSEHDIFKKHKITIEKRLNQGKVGNTDDSDFGSDGFGKNCICHVIPYDMRVKKMYILSMLEILGVIIIPITLCLSKV